ncbi:MAG: hypothetical protein R3F02_00780 [Thiolinea sp.]
MCSANGNCIKLALLVSGTGLPVWQYEMVQRLREIPHVSIVLVLQRSGKQQDWSEKLIGKVTGFFSYLEAVALGWKGQADKLCDVKPLLENTPVLDTGLPAARQIFEAGRIDLLIDLQGHAPAEDYFYATSSQQIWRYFYSENRALQPERAGVREYAAGRNRFVSGVISQGLCGKVHYLLVAHNGINRPLFTQNVDQMLWKIADFIPHLLRQISTVEALHQHVQQRHDHCLTQIPEQLRENRKIVSNDVPLSAAWQLLGRGLKQTGVKVWNRVQWTQVQEQWILLLGSADVFRQETDVSKLPRLRKIIPPPDRFWADPFLVSEAGREYVFFEELIYRQGKGTLACMELFPDQSHGQPVTVMDKPYHLSYPFIFRFQGQLYMVPESAENRTLDLYRCEQFPSRWVKVKTIMTDVEAYDATLYEDEQGCWWLFVCMRHHEYASTNELLYLFSAADPLTDDWEPHPCNPVVTDAATARPAGNLLRLNGKLYRPSQNCAASYGRGLNLNEVLALNKQEYREQAGSQLIPAGYAGLDGVHTLNCLNDKVVSDGILLHKRSWFRKKD